MKNVPHLVWFRKHFNLVRRNYRFQSVCLILLLCLVSLIGCENQSNDPIDVQNIVGFKEDINELKEDFADLQTQNDQLFDKINGLETLIKESNLNRNSMLIEYQQQLNRLENVVKKLPDLEIILGRILNVKEEDDVIFFEIDTVEWLSYEEAIQAIQEDKNMSREEAEHQIPNGFYIRNIEIERTPYQVSSDYTAYIIEEVQLKYTKEFLNVVNEYVEMDEEEFRPLYKLYIIDNEIVQIQQVYIP